MKNHRFFMLLAVAAALFFLTSVEVQATVGGTVTLARHYDLSALTTLTFSYNNCALGDLNNDGKIDYLMYSDSKRMAAFADDGAGGLTKLWEYVGPGSLPEPVETYQDGFSIWDIDNDGDNEVVGAFATTTGFMELRVVDGNSGTIEYSLQLPYLKNREGRDSSIDLRCHMGIANFRGLSQPQDIVLMIENNKERTGRTGTDEIWCYDNTLTALWDTNDDPCDLDGIYSHHAHTYDIDDDGKDELVTCWIFDDDGSRIAFISDANYQPWKQHLDKCYIGDFVSTNEGVEIWSSIEWCKGRMHDAAGNQLWAVPYGLQNDLGIAGGEFDSTNDGPEFVAYHAGATGKTRYNKTYAGEDGTELASIGLVDEHMCMSMDWTGDRTKEVIYRPMDGGLLFDPLDGDIVLMGNDEEGGYFPADACTLNAAGNHATGHVADVYGDNREEIIICDDDEILVYTNSATNPDPQASPWGDDYYALMIATEHCDMHVERKFWPAGEPPVTFKISGLIRESDLTPIDTVSVDANNGGGSDTTDQTGYYEVSVPNDWSGTVTPTKAGWTFEPTYRSYSNVTSDQTGQNYTGTYAGAPEIYVYDINMTGYEPKTGKYAAKATIWIKDTELTNIADATVTGDWTGAAPETGAQGVTLGDGKVTIESDVVKGGGNYTFTVTDVTATGYTYDSTLNNETSDSITLPAGDEDPPTPDPMTWATVPYATGSSSITMVATTADDPSGVEYFFDETSGNPGGSDSEWQENTDYTDDILDPNTTYTYQVKARDKSAAQNETGFSTLESATTDPLGPELDMYVYDITMAGYEGKTGYYYATSTVWIKDVCDVNVSGATVYGDWSGATVKGDGEMTTGGDGKATLESDTVKGGGVFTFTVTDVTATGYTYNSTLNNETSDSVTIP